jgi:hypothetical protein
MNDANAPPPPPTPPTPGPLPNVKPVGPVTIFVCLLSTLAGGFLGAGASILYGKCNLFGPSTGMWVETKGVILGAPAGLLVGVGWCLVMYRLTREYHKRPHKFLLSGMGWGVLAGIVATFMLHVGLMIWLGSAKPNAILVGMFFGIPTGATVGLVCGLTWRKAVTRQL